MKISARLTIPVVRFLLRRICRVYDSELGEIPDKGPAVIAMNHINFLEVPLMFTHLKPRPVYGIVKKETWKSKILGFFGNSWEAIPVDRDNPGFSTMRKFREILCGKGMLLIAPEGTRSGTGTLKRGNPGIVSIAMHSNAMIIPVAHYGGEKIWKNIKSFRRTKFYIKTGEPFKIKQDKKMNSRTRHEATDEIMLQIAKLLPKQMHGIYKDCQVTTKYIEFINKSGDK